MNIIFIFYMPLYVTVMNDYRNSLIGLVLTFSMEISKMANQFQSIPYLWNCYSYVVIAEIYTWQSFGMQQLLEMWNLLRLENVQHSKVWQVWLPRQLSFRSPYPIPFPQIKKNKLENIRREVLKGNRTCSDIFSQDIKASWFHGSDGVE